MIGHVYSWGEMKDGKLGHHQIPNNSKSDKITAFLDTPKKVTFLIAPKILILLQVASLAEHKIIMGTCGDTYSCVLTSKGEIFVWGRHFEKDDASKGNRSQDLIKPKLLQTVGNHNQASVYIKIVTYANHNAALDKDGNMYTWGEK